MKIVFILKFQCLGEGEIKNFGKPSDLLNDENSVLFELTKKLSKSERQTLLDIINQNKSNNKKLLMAKSQSQHSLEVKEIDEDRETKYKSYVNYAVTVEQR